MMPNVKLILGGVLIAVLLSGVLYIRYLRNANENLRAEVQVLAVQLETQNKAVLALKKEAELKLAASQKALSEAKAKTEQASKKATVIYKSQPTGDLCQSALDLVNGK